MVINKIFCIIGPSGCGKSTIEKELQKKYPNLKPVVSATSRLPRENEVHGKDYTFLTSDGFRKRKERDEFIEFRSYHTLRGDKSETWWYGTLKSSIDLDEHNYLTVVDIDGYKALVDYFPAGSVHPIVIEVKPETCLTRSVSRENENKLPNHKEVARRFASEVVMFQDFYNFMPNKMKFNNDKSMPIDEISKYIDEVMDVPKFGMSIEEALHRLVEATFIVDSPSVISTVLQEYCSKYGARITVKIERP